MPKGKLTLSLDKEVSQLAHRTARLSGKSISTLLKEYLLQEERKINSHEVSPSVVKWIGLLKTSKTYKELREEQIGFKIKKYNQ
jgi:hypothetical protein